MFQIWKDTLSNSPLRYKDDYVMWDDPTQPLSSQHLEYIDLGVSQESNSQGRSLVDSC